MELLTLEQLYQSYPVLEDIAIRLELSKTEAEKKNKEKKESFKPRAEEVESQKSRSSRGAIYSASCEHAKIEKFYKDGKWEQTYHPFQSGREPFETNLMRIMSRSPKALSIIIITGSKSNRSSAPEKILVKIDGALTDLPDSAKEENKSEVLDTIKSQLGDLTEQMKTNPAINTDSQGQNNLAQLSFAQQLTKIEHNYKIETLKRDHKYEIDKICSEHDKQIDELNDTIDELNEIIEEMELDKADTEENLSGIDKKIEEAQNPSIFKMLGKVGANILENVVKEHADGLAKLGNIDPQEIKEYFLKKEEEKKQVAATNNETSFSAAAIVENETYSKLDAAKKEFADAYIEIIDGLSLEEIQMLTATFKHALVEEASGSISVNGRVLEAQLKVALEIKKPTEETQTS